MLHDQLGCVIVAMKWSARLKVKHKGKNTLLCGVDPVPQSLLSCLKARKGRQVPLGLGKGEACLKEGCVVRQLSMTGVSLLLLPPEGSPRHATCHHRGSHGESAPFNFCLPSAKR